MVGIPTCFYFQNTINKYSAETHYIYKYLHSPWHTSFQQIHIDKYIRTNLDSVIFIYKIIAVEDSAAIIHNCWRKWYLRELNIQEVLYVGWWKEPGFNIYTVKPVTRGHLKKCPYMTGVPSSQVRFNVKVYFGSQKMQFRHPNFDI